MPKALLNKGKPAENKTTRAKPIINFILNSFLKMHNDLYSDLYLLFTPI